MIGVSLSKWTMSYFAAALLALLGAELLMIAGFGFPSKPVAAPQTLGEAAQNVDGVKWAEVRLIYDPPWTPNMMSPEAKEYLGIGR